MVLSPFVLVVGAGSVPCMCGRFAIDDKANRLLEGVVAEHGIRALADWQKYVPAYNIKPTQQVVTLLHSSRLGEDVATTSRWSLVPPWSKTIESRATFNARVEGIAAKPTWRGPVRSSRCLIPAAGWFEWTGPKQARVPHWIHPAGGLVMFAGLFSWWADPQVPEGDESRWHLTSTIVTMPAPPELAHIHDRAPVCVPEALWAEWIDPGVKGTQEYVEHVAEAAVAVSGGMAVHPVAPLRADGPGLLAAL